jgi:anthranilate phosphoribosyltransferase
MMKYYIEKAIAKENLSFDEAYDAMISIMNGSVDNSNLAGLLIALKSKGESASEVAGFAKAMRDKSIKIHSDSDNAIDVCGTGGDNSGTFNISTAVAFVAAGAGIKVAKHGNRSISSKSGSADVLQELGININLTKEQAEEALNRIGITFLFAPLYHPAMKYAAQVRKELGIKTVFNMLGPLTNPAGVKKQIIGTFSRSAAKIMCEALNYLDSEKVCFICCNDMFDEVHLGDFTTIYEFAKGSENKFYDISNDDFDYPKIHFNQIKGDSSAENAKIILEVLGNKTMNGAYHTIAANAALALYISGYSENLKECARAAEDSILTGSAIDKLNELKNFSLQFA